MASSASCTPTESSSIKGISNTRKANSTPPLRSKWNKTNNNARNINNQTHSNKGGGGTPNSRYHVNCCTKRSLLKVPKPNDSSPSEIIYANDLLRRNNVEECKSEEFASWSFLREREVEEKGSVIFANQDKEEFAEVEGMAGDIRVLEGRRQRRHWTQRDRSTMSVHFLKANLAEEGCQEAQLDVAKKLLQDSKDADFMESVQRDNAKKAVYWLVKSSEQGNQEATRLLQECLQEAHGITTQNLIDVKHCVNTPTNEKLTFKAAKQLFERLSNGEKFITTSQLLARIHSISKKVHFASDEPSSQEVEDSPPNSLNREEDEDGDGLPSVGLNETFTLSSPNRSHLPSSPPVPDPEDDNEKGEDNLQINGIGDEGEKLTMEDIMKCAASFNAGECPTTAIDSSKKELERQQWSFRSQLNAFVFQLLILSSLTGAASFNCIAILGASYLSLWASFNLIGTKKKHSNFKDWSKAFGSVQLDNQTWSDSIPEKRLILNNVLPYLIAVGASLALFHFLEGLNTLKLITGLLVIYGIHHGTSSSRFPGARTAVFLVVLNAPRVWCLLSDYVKSEYGEPTFLDPIKEEFTKHLQDVVPLANSSSVILVVQIVAILAFSLGSLKTFLHKRLPELLIATWATHLVHVIHAEEEIVDVSLGLLVSATLITGILILHSQLDVLKMSIALVVSTLVGLLFVSLVSSSVEECPIRIALSGIQLTKEPVFAKGAHNIEDLPLLPWKVYDEECHRKAWKTNSPAYTQLHCREKYGKNPTAVQWTGRVSIIKVRDVSNSIFPTTDGDPTFEILVNILPEDKLPEKTTSWQFLHGESQQDQPPSPAAVLVPTSQIMDETLKKKMVKFILELRSGDVMEFYGILNPSSAGALKPEIEVLRSIKCVKCAFAEEQKDFFVHHQKYDTQQAEDSRHNTRASHSGIKTARNGNSNEPGLFVTLIRKLKQFLYKLMAAVQGTFNLNQTNALK